VAETVVSRTAIVSGTVTRIQSGISMTTPYSTEAVSLPQTTTAIHHLLKRRRRFIFNCDLDGMLSAALLVAELNWEPIGVSACTGSDKDAFWIVPHYHTSLDGVVFIDSWVDVARDTFAALDQHVVACTMREAQRFAMNPARLNPNLIWLRICQDAHDGSPPIHHYQNKYPFGTVHFLIACLEHLGSLKPWRVCRRANALDLILRADDAFCNTCIYNSNALQWWGHLTCLGGYWTRAICRRAKRAVPAPPAGSKPTAKKTHYKAMNAPVEAFIRTVARRNKVLLHSTSTDGNFGQHLRTHGFTQEVSDYVLEITEAAFGKNGGLQLDHFARAHLAKVTGYGLKVTADSRKRLIIRLARKFGLFSYAFTDQRTVSMTLFNGLSEHPDAEKPAESP